MKNGRLVVTGILLALFLLSSLGASYAWFSTHHALDPKLSFSAGSPEEYTVFKMTCPASDSDLLITEVDTVGTDGFSASDLQFGKIINLSSLDRTNYVYYAIKIPKVDGGRVDLSVTFGNSGGGHFKIYVPRRDANGEVITEGEVISTEQYTDAEVLGSIQEIETENDATFLRYSAVLSALMPEQLSAAADMEALFRDSEEFDMDDIDGRELTIDTSEIGGEYYYLYVKLLPNIELYKYFVDYLWNHMPFFLAYDVRVGLTVSP